MSEGEPESVGEQVQYAMTGEVRRTNWFAVFMAFIVGVGLGIILGLLLAYFVILWAASYESEPSIQSGGFIISSPRFAAASSPAMTTPSAAPRNRPSANASQGFTPPGYASASPTWKW
jgi:hypothetical protein